MRENEDGWQELCRQASVEKDPEKQMQLVRQINELLEAKDRRLQRSSTKLTSEGTTVFQIAYDEMLLLPGQSC